MSGTPNKWIATPSMPANLITSGTELGPGVLLPDGRAFYIGGTSSTALFSPPTPANPTGSWVAGPTIPGGFGGNDSTAAMLPNGRVLFDVGGTPFLASNGVTFYEYDPISNTINQVANIPVPFATSLAGVPVYMTRTL